MIIDNPFDILDSYLDLTLSALTDNDWNILEYLSHHTDYEVRLYLAEVLSYFHCLNSENILMKMLDDTEILVVSSACDSLSFSDSLQVFDALNKCTKSSHFIIRGYAYMSIGEILSRKVVKINDLDYFSCFLKREKSVWVKASIAYLLCINDYHNNVSYIIDLLNNRYYNYRLYALNLIDSLLKKSISIDKQYIRHILLLRIKIEKNRVVYSRITEIIESYQKTIP